jgi:hypothetical protein
MIPEAAITHWRNVVPWPPDAQVEQDLILSRALVEMFGNPRLSKALLLRGGTALYKLGVLPPRRYSEDIDLVQSAALSDRSSTPSGNGLTPFSGSRGARTTPAT